MALELSRITPDDAAAALASYPRRFKALLIPGLGDEERDDDLEVGDGVDPDEGPEDRLRRLGPDGKSALQHTRDAAERIAVLGRALQRIVTVERPSLPAAVVDGAVAAPSAPGQGPLTAVGVADFLTVECQSLSASLRDLSIDDWNRTGTIEGSGRTVTALDVVRQAVAAGYDALRAVEAAVG